MAATGTAGRIRTSEPALPLVVHRCMHPQVEEGAHVRACIGIASGCGAFAFMCPLL